MKDRIKTKTPLTNKKIGSLLVLEKIGKNKRGRSLWKCQCSCGNFCEFEEGHLTGGYRTSCGCYANREANCLDKKVITTREKGVQYKKWALYKKVPFELLEEEFCQLIFQNCHYCGIEPSNTYNHFSRKDKFSIKYNGIDKIIPKLGYIAENVVTCCKRCNTAKNDMSTDDFFKLIERIYNYSVIKNKLRDKLKK